MAKPKPKPAFLGLRTAIYPAEDLSKGKAWYTKVLGQDPYFDQPFYVGYNVGGYELGLVPAPATLRRGDDATAYWGVLDCKAAYANLLKAGAKARSEPKDVGEGILVATVTDPFGNTLGLIENPHFKAE